MHRRHPTAPACPCPTGLQDEAAAAAASLSSAAAVERIHTVFGAVGADLRQTGIKEFRARAQAFWDAAVKDKDAGVIRQLAEAPFETGDL